MQIMAPNGDYNIRFFIVARCLEREKWDGRKEKDSNSKNAGREGEEGEERGNNKSELTQRINKTVILTFLPGEAGKWELQNGQTVSFKNPKGGREGEEGEERGNNKSDKE